MEDQLISFETAKLAIQKGFNHFPYVDFADEPIDSNMSETRKLITYINVTQSLLQKWLRDEHHIHIHIEYLDNILNFGFVITTIFNNTLINEGTFNHKLYEEALEKGLQEALKLIK